MTILSIKRNWPAKDFVDRWFLQSNYPSLYIALKYDNSQQKQYIQVLQERNLNSASFLDQDLYPSPYE